MKPLFRVPVWRVQSVACVVVGCTLSAATASAWAQASSSPAPSASTSAKTPAAAEAAPTFDVLEYAVEGNTVLPVPAIEKAVMPFMGPGKTLADVESARAALEKAYQDAGYLTVFVDLPEQSTADGVIRLNVLEGKVGRLSVTGSHYFSQGYIRQQVPELAEGRVPNFNVVQAQLSDINRTEDRRVQPVLKPGPTSGTVDAELQVTDQAPVHGSLELNNDHAQFTKPWRLQGTVHYDNLFQRDHSLSATAIIAPQNPQESAVFLADYVVPAGGGDNWRLGYLYSNSDIQALSSSTVLGKGMNLSLYRLWNLPSTPSLSHTFSFGADYKDIKEQTRVGSDSLMAPIKYIPFSLVYAAALQEDSGASSTLTANMVFGFKRLMQENHDCGFGDNDQFDCKHQGADGGFGYLRIDARHSEPIKSWSLDMRVAGQIASQALVSAEQYAIGGAETVRGYLAGEAIGDNGLLTSMELRTPNLVPGSSPSSSSDKTAAATPAWRDVTDLRLYGFADAGRVRTINASQGQPAVQVLASVGTGLKLKSRKYMSLTLEAALPLRSGMATQIHDPHMLMALGLDF